MAEVDAETTHAYRRLVERLLTQAEQVKPDKQIEPPLTETHLGDSFWLIQGEDEQIAKRFSQQTQFAAVEIAFREKFYHLLANTTIDEPGFIQIWNLLDIISIFSDNEQCEPGLIFWLIEELLDSQTIEGCRKVFDYLESRRERNTKKHFKQKSLIILRSCNELLRRLSRAEDTVFCGRVFIFLFQSFPLGDKSAVNLRGEYHTENVTTFDENVTSGGNKDDEMDVEPSNGQDASARVEEPDTVSQTPAQESPKAPKLVVSKSDDKGEETKIDLDRLYPMFWSLQAYFSAPTKTFDPHHFATFKSGLEATLSTFRSMHMDMENSGAARTSEETRKSSKRKRTADGQEIASSFNPKYLTSRDLFDLEINDTAFRRHVLVQALILLDFLLSLTPKAKAKMADMTNKSVLYGFVLNDEDTRWAAKTRKAIEEYLQEGVGGKFYYRMVDTVLSRDKNWVRWKAEGCPLIENPPVSVTEYAGAREQATKVYANKRLRPSPMGSLNLSFLSEGESTAGLERLAESERFTVPAADSFLMGIMDDDLDIDMASTKADKEHAMRAKASKTWRILRLSAKSKLAAFPKLEDGKNVRALFETNPPTEDTPQTLEGTPQVTEAATKAPGENQAAELGPNHGVGNAEKENPIVATEQTSAESTDVIAAGKKEQET
ncbi:nuclear matrix protein [Aspergillus steynii IBT 23096]|uniref:Nuclear matrix protein n=1 Tax=Aspergillus steynii IBT 23096 TaxID=1392250 RepID=A0A2I2GCF3_9EURO|nr:nuclear matrix protein [Aspergillus steynii IBT 23096]PLB50564.1 nuclear matrix protein [Aspergillus steynii IBT 23096]